VSFESPSEILSSRGPSQISFRRSIDRSQLSAVPTSVRDSSLGVAKDPLRRTPHCLSTPASSRSKRPFPGFDDNLPKSSFVPFLSFLPTSTVYSRRCFAGLLHPAADHGVHHVSSCFRTCAGQGTAQSGPSPLAAAFAVLMSRRPPSQLVQTGRSRRNPWSTTRALRLNLVRFSRRRCVQFRGAPSHPEGSNFTLLPPTARKRPAFASTVGAFQPEGLCAPVRHVWIVNHSQWCFHPSKRSPHYQRTSGHCTVRKPYDHPVVLPSRRCA